MTPSARLRAYRDRPIAAHERRAAMCAVTLLLTTTTVALLLTRTPTTRRTDSSPSAGLLSQPRPLEGPRALSPAEQRTVRGFLAGYLRYLYGHSTAAQITDATAPFTHSLQTHPPRVPPGLKTLKPRVLRLLARAAPAGLLGVTAIVSDQRHLDYRVPLFLTSSRGRLLVSGLDTR